MTRATIRNVIDAWGHTAPTVWRTMHFDPAHCLNGTRVTMDAFKHFGFHPKPVSVVCVAMNKLWWEQIERVGRGVASQEESDAWAALGGYAVGIDTTDQSDPKKWAGHLVAQVAGWLLDSSTEQFDRPQKGIKVSPVIAGEIQPGFLDGNLAQSFTNSDGSRLSYMVRPDDKTYLDASGFQRHGINREATKHLIERMTLFIRQER